MPCLRHGGAVTDARRDRPVREGNAMNDNLMVGAPPAPENR